MTWLDSSHHNYAQIFWKQWIKLLLTWCRDDNVYLLDFELNFGFLYEKCCQIIIRKPLTNSNMKHYQFSDRIKNDPIQHNKFDTKDLWWHLLGNVRAKVYISVDRKIIHCKDVRAKAFTYSLEDFDIIQFMAGNYSLQLWLAIMAGNYFLQLFLAIMACNHGL